MTVAIFILQWACKAVTLISNLCGNDPEQIKTACILAVEGPAYMTPRNM